jgi:hypothetical protein
MKSSTLKEGQVVRNYGKEFIARDVTKGKTPNGLGQTVWYYRGECTDNPCNDRIRRTGFNGGRYSWTA